MKRKSTEESDQALALAREIERVREFHSVDVQIDHSAGMIQQLLEQYEERVQAVIHKSEPASHSGYTADARRRYRVNNIRTYRNWFGYGCDICGGDPCKPVFMALEIGGWRGRLLLDVCKDCAKRLVERIDARLEESAARELKG